MLTQQRLKELFTYDPETGKFTRNMSVQGRHAEVIAGGMTVKGYLSIGVGDADWRLKRKRLPT